MNPFEILLILVVSNFLILNLVRFEKILSGFSNTIEALGLLAILSVPITYFLYKRNEASTIRTNLASVSITRIDLNGTATLKNSSAVLGSVLRVRIYKPKRPGHPKYFAIQSTYSEVFSAMKDINYTEWHSEPDRDVALSVNEEVQFHLKNLTKDEEFFIQLAPVKIVITNNYGDSITKFLIFRYVSKEADFHIPPAEDIFHPKNLWVLNFSKILE
jgi:hypothetical protein